MDKVKENGKTPAEIATEAAKHAGQTVRDKTKNGVKKIDEAVKPTGPKMDGVKK
jgi:hypothetical protein